MSSLKQKTLKQKTLSGVIWSSVQRFGSMGITFAANVILARLLSPSDFGCVGMLMIFISISNTFIDGGFGSALIQKKQPTNEDYSTIFYWNILLSVVLYILLFWCAPFIANFYRIPILSSVLRFQGIVLLFNAISVVQYNQLRKQLRFKQLSIVEIISAVISLAFAIIAAMNGFGVWSLVIQQIMLSVLKSIFLWVVSKWKPLLAFSTKSFKELFRFGGFILLSNLFSTFSNEIQGLLVGRMFTPVALGLYNQAHRLEGSLATSASSVIDQVTYPVMSSMQDERLKLISALKKFIQIPAYICAPIMGLLIVIAKPVILLVYGNQWMECVPYFQILCTAGLAVCLQGSANNSIAAVGKSNVFFKWTIIKRSITISLCIIGITIGGMYGMLWSCSIGAWVVYLINAYLVEKHIGYMVYSQIIDVLPFIILSVAVSFVTYWVGAYFFISLAPITILQFFLYTSLYLIASSLLKLKPYLYIKQIITNRVLLK